MNVLAYFDYYPSWSADRTLMQGFNIIGQAQLGFPLRWMLFR